ncbi:uncharacterized protein [Nicotiana sylvestris]|uniref:uncharacterized protein n=1 Tax=Nicotiana sylvestris TaxID=4096 RepID=UPI00388C498F
MGSIFPENSVGSYESLTQIAVKDRVASCGTNLGSHLLTKRKFPDMNHGSRNGWNKVGILVDRDLRESVIEIRRVKDRLAIQLVVGELTLNVISTYTPQGGLDVKVKRCFWEDLDEVVRGIPPTEKLFIGGDFNGHIGTSTGGYSEVHGSFGFGDRNGGGTTFLDFAKAFESVIVNSYFSKRGKHLITFLSAVAKTHIDYLFLRRGDKGLCKVCKFILSKSLESQHRLLVMDVAIMMKRKKQDV